MSGIVDGQAVDAVDSNAAWLAKNGPDSAIGPIGLTGLGSTAITDIQQELNGLDAFSGRAANAGPTSVPTYTNNDVGSAGDALRSRADSLTQKFNSSAGHTHDGSTGNGGPIQSASLKNFPLAGYIEQGVTLTGVTGGTTDVSTQLSGKVASTGITGLGVVVTAPFNKVVLRQATGPNAGEAFTDGSGNVVYARLTNSGSTWTLTYYSVVSSIETPYSFGTASNVDWYYQELFNPAVSTPVYSPFANIPSDNPTADVVTATQSQQGKVLLSSAAGADVGATGSVGTPNATVANADHVHKGLHSLAIVGDTQLFGDIQIQGSAGLTVTRVGNTITFSAGGGLAFYQENPSQVPDGIATDYTLLNTPYSQASVLVFVNGIERQVSVAWSLVGNIVRFNSGYIPVLGNDVQVFYAKQSGAAAPNVTPTVEYRTLSSGEITSGQLTLSNTPSISGEVVLDVIGGGPQFYGDDFTVSGAILSWSGLGLDGILSAGDKVRIQYAF